MASKVGRRSWGATTTSSITIGVISLHTHTQGFSGPATGFLHYKILLVVVVLMESESNIVNTTTSNPLLALYHTIRLMQYYLLVVLLLRSN